MPKQVNLTYRFPKYVSGAILNSLPYPLQPTHTKLCKVLQFQLYLQSFMEYMEYVMPYHGIILSMKKYSACCVPLILSVGQCLTQSRCGFTIQGVTIVKSDADRRATGNMYTRFLRQYQGHVKCLSQRGASKLIVVLQRLNVGWLLKECGRKCLHYSMPCKPQYKMCENTKIKLLKKSAVAPYFKADEILNKSFDTRSIKTFSSPHSGKAIIK